MTDRAAQIQLDKLAAALHVPTERIEFLVVLGADHLSDLRERIVTNLHARYAKEYQRYSAPGRRIPLRLALPFASRYLPPRLLGRSINGALLDGRSSRTLELLSTIDPVVVANAAPFMNPTMIGRLAELASPEMLNGVVDELMGRRDFDTADLFVDYVTGYLMAPVDSLENGAAPPTAHHRRRLLRRVWEKL